MMNIKSVDKTYFNAIVLKENDITQTFHILESEEMSKRKFIIVK